MDHRRFDPGEDARLTLRVPVAWLALLAAVSLHVAAGFLASLLPDPPKAQQRVELTLAPAPRSAPEPPADAPTPRAEPEPRRKPRVKAKPPSRREPSTSPVAPELQPSEEPPENRARLPEVETSPEPTSPPEPSTWEERLRAQLSATTPRRAPAPSGALAPSSSTVDRVAGADPRLHDEKTERRLMENFGPFFRRGLEALRGHWHPNDVLRKHDAARRCGSQRRTTYAVAVLDKEGQVVDVDLKKPSGCPELDEEAIAAFKRVAHFPHPPAGIFVGPDGTPLETARYPVRFIVTFDGGLRLDWR